MRNITTCYRIYSLHNKRYLSNKLYVNKINLEQKYWNRKDMYRVDEFELVNPKELEELASKWIYDYLNK